MRRLSAYYGFWHYLGHYGLRVAVATMLILISVALLITLELLRRRSERIRRGNVVES